MSIATETFEAVYSTLTGVRATLKQGRSEELRAICANIGAERMDSEMGQFNSLDTRVRLVESEIPESMKIEVGEKIEMDAHGTGYVEYRIGGVYRQDGVVRLTLEDLYE